MSNWKENAKEAAVVILGIAAVAGVYLILGSIDPMLIASDGFVEFLDGF